ncbi:MAG: hypothetical protein M0008_05995 [Actinomycetota bacterium]|nr:hypothetical protein [Actinomycetota bacterium]
MTTAARAETSQASKVVLLARLVTHPRDLRVRKDSVAFITPSTPCADHGVDGLDAHLRHGLLRDQIGPSFSYVIARSRCPEPTPTSTRDYCDDVHFLASLDYCWAKVPGGCHRGFTVDHAWMTPNPRPTRRLRSPLRGQAVLDQRNGDLLRG